MCGYQELSVGDLETDTVLVAAQVIPVSGSSEWERQLFPLWFQLYRDKQISTLF